MSPAHLNPFNNKLCYYPNLCNISKAYYDEFIDRENYCEEYTGFMILFPAPSPPSESTCPVSPAR